MAKKKVLLIGIDPKLIDSSMLAATGWDTNRVQAAAEDVIKRLMELGYEVQLCFIDFGETAESVVSDILSQKKFTVSWLVEVLEYCRSIPFYLRK